MQLVYLPTNSRIHHKNQQFNVGTYTSPMDPMGNYLTLRGLIHPAKNLQDTSTDVEEATAGMTLVGGLRSGFGTGIAWLKWLNAWTMQVDHCQYKMTSFKNWNLDIVNVFQGVYIPCIDFYPVNALFSECDFLSCSKSLPDRIFTVKI